MKKKGREIMNNSKYKIGEWENYRSIAKDYGLTIPALKKIFKEEGLLLGNDLSQFAQDNKIGIKETISNDYGENERILWNIPEISQILGNRNLTPLIGDETYLFVENFSQLTENIAYLGKSLLSFLQFPISIEDNIKPYPLWITEQYGSSEIHFIEKAVSGLHEAVFENGKYLMVEDQKEFNKFLSEDFFFAFELTKIYPANEDEKLRLVFFNKLYQFFGDWATTKRIKQFHRQPAKNTKFI